MSPSPTARTVGLLLAGLLVALSLAATSNAQQVTIQAPFNTVRDSFNERFGINFGFNIRGSQQLPGDDGGTAIVGLLRDGSFSPNIEFRQGGFGTAIPPFGGFDQNATTRSGFAVLGDAGDLFFNFDFSQASSRSLVSQTPVITLTSGYPGSISDQTQTPFVTSVTPIVNGWPARRFPRMRFSPADVMQSAPYQVSPVLERYRRLQEMQRNAADAAKQQATRRAAAPARRTPPARTTRPQSFSDRLAAAGQSSAGQPTESVADIRRRQRSAVQTEQDEALESYHRGLNAESKGKLAVAKIHYRIAARAATGELKQRAEARLRALSEPSSTGKTSP